MPNFIIKISGGSWFNGKIAQLVINKPKNIYLSPFKIIKREVVNEIVKYEGLFPYVDGLILRITSSINQIPINTIREKPVVEITTYTDHSKFGLI